MQVLEAPGSAVSLPHSQAAQGTAELFELLQQAWDTWEHNGNISTFQPLAGQQKSPSATPCLPVPRYPLPAAPALAPHTMGAANKLINQ